MFNFGSETPWKPLDLVILQPEDGYLCWLPQEQFSAQDFGETAEPQMYMDHTTDAEQVQLGTVKLLV